MAVTSLTTLLDRVRERADMVGSAFVADAATGLYAWVNEANAKLHGMLVEALGEEYVSSSSVLTTVAGTSDYALPATFYKLYGVDISYGSNTISLEPYMRAERNHFRNANINSAGREYGFNVPRYSLVGSQLRLYPIPQSVLTGAILFAPEATLLTAGADTVSYPNGWERFIVLDAAIQALLKEESSITALVNERATVIQEIERAKESRDLAHPKRVVDVNSTDRWL
jgi:hypothetical protein